ncbi:MAG: hypothetical protein HYV07_08635 [Deltaproteobacteria bacterium]|nr:hypothetical protein [Deltaproteobacteria bacterium]
MVRRALLIPTLAILACGAEPSADRGPVERTEKDAFGLVTCSGQTSERTCFTHRALLGISMGASGAGQLGFAHPELFDTIGMLGIPLLDWVYMVRMVTKFHLAGFCDRERILANLDSIADTHSPGFCGPVRGTDKLEPTGKLVEPSHDFNHFYLAVSDGAGPGFGREMLFHSFIDLAYAFGNMFYPPNPEAPSLPPGVPPSEKDRPNRERCSQPVVIEGLKHLEYNPDGSYPSITFCDTSTDGPNFNPRVTDEPVGIALAVDYNRNGKRDYAEPLLLFHQERFVDSGSSANDLFDWSTNPTGTAGNELFDEGEAYQDDGLDGVPGTGDYGEGNGKFDYSPGVDNVFAQNPRFLVESADEGQLARLNVYTDAGLRDSILSVGGTNWFWAQLKRRFGSERAREYADFGALLPGQRDFDFLAVDYSAEKLGQAAFVRYGKVDASQRDIERGDGGHVGPGDQVVSRLLTALGFTEARMQEPNRRVVRDPEPFDEMIRIESFASEALGQDQPYGVMLPPGYNQSNERYPVVYFLHGQGQEFSEMLASAILYFGYQADSNIDDTRRRGESDWAKFIMVFPNSECRPGDCRDGTFNTNHPDGIRYGDVFFELMRHVEGKYRTRVPTEVPLE